MLRPFFFLALATLFLACEKSEQAPRLADCDEMIIEQLGYTPGEPDFSTRNCQEYLNKFRSPAGEAFYVPACTCCDLILRVFDCKGENTCTPEGLCPEFQAMELVGAVGVKRR